MNIHSANSLAPSVRARQGALPIKQPFGAEAAIIFHAPGSEIYSAGEPSGNLYRVDFGAVRIFRVHSDGRRQISSFHLADELFGFEEDAVHRFFAEAIGATGIQVVAKADRGRFASEILPLTIHNLLRAQEHLLVLGRQSASERIAALLLDMSERLGGVNAFELPMSRSDIADYLGLTIETVSRVLTRLREEGTIRLAGLRGVEIVKPQALALIVS